MQRRNHGFGVNTSGNSGAFRTPISSLNMPQISGKDNSKGKNEAGGITTGKTLSFGSAGGGRGGNAPSSLLSSTTSHNMLLRICIATVLGVAIYFTLKNGDSKDGLVRNSTSISKNLSQELVKESSQELNTSTESYHEMFDSQKAIHPKAEIIEPFRTTKDGRQVPNYHLQDLIDAFDTEERMFQSKPVARGLSGRPLADTPSMQSGAKRAHVNNCHLTVDSLAYWNEYPLPGEEGDGPDNNVTKVTTFHVPKGKDKQEYYLSFSPDSGGWNNIRMSMEIIFVLAAATGRTLVLPPKEPLYLLHHDADERHKGFADFFPLYTEAFQRQVKIISFAEFLKRTSSDPQFAMTDEVTRKNINASSEHCDKRDASPISCKYVYEYLKTVGYTANMSAVETCVIFDENYFKTSDNETISPHVHDFVETMCGPKRTPFFWTNEFNSEHRLLHFRASEKQYRLLTHFYGMIHFTNPVYDNYYKRFVRDYLHYNDAIYCAAGKVVMALQLESQQKSESNTRDALSGSGPYNAFHVRRGDLQYKKVKISAMEWYQNTKDILDPGQILYIATDERNKTFFDDLKAHYELRFLDDYWELADLDSLDPNYMGMIDTIIASRASIFVGTFFSTFTGYINRLRGYHGLSMKKSYYSFLPKKNHTHSWNIVDDFIYAYEWPDGWIGIDANVFPTRDVF